MARKNKIYSFIEKIHLSAIGNFFTHDGGGKGIKRFNRVLWRQVGRVALIKASRKVRGLSSINVRVALSQWVIGTS